MTAIPQVYLDHLNAVTGPDPASVRDYWEPDGIWEFPYSVSLMGSVMRLEGVEAIVDRFSGDSMFGDEWTFTDMRAWAIADSPDYVLEMHGSSIVAATGAPYEQDYIIRFGLAENGKLAWMREFWDPTRM